MSAPSDVLGVLKTVFPSLDEATMLRVLEKHKDSYGAAVDELLTINSEPQGQLDQEDDRSPAMNNAHAPQLDALKRVTEMFPELTMSVIGGALHFNQGEAEGAIDMLLNIGQDQEAITQIRDMNPERKAQHAEDKAREREAELAAQAAELARQQAEQERLLAEQRKAQELEKERIAAAAIAKEKARLELEKALLEEKLALEAQAKEKAEQQLKQVLVAPAPRLEISESVIQLKEEVARRALEVHRHKAEEAATAAKLAATEEHVRKQQQQIMALQAAQAAQKSCSLAAEYSQKTKELVVSWRLGADRAATSYDWIGVFPLASAHDKSKYQTYISTNSLPTSSHCVPLPTEPGLYICNFYHGKNQELIGHSQHIFLGPSLSMTAEVDVAASKIHLNYQVVTGNPTTKDWIGFYRSDKPDNTYLDYMYLSPDVLQGTWSVDLPRRGGYDYEFRFFSSVLKQHMTVSNKLTLPKGDYLTVKSIDVPVGTNAKDTVTWNVVSVDPSSWDWIELYNLGTKQRETWSYADHSLGSAIFTVPRTPGKYIYRYWARSIGSGPMALSPEFEVVNRDKVDVKSADGLVQVTCDIHSIVPTKNCWVGIFPENGTQYITFKYISEGSTLTFQLAPGKYDARFFSASNKKVDIARSPVFTI